ncbi:unnamed protein product [Medioppia subpectinata]|uniref:MD-2-related lipid-recognition domain-containing protein n=1 Tax=Medioppia subpectinata TaxID=1979941 RepID=A0A7R9KLG7_9ACAR|nr:unnamed protein product [Medioppia subpectinata]CAG2105650.1 unnamed protein product [Medioppia subpectinata]
MNAFLTLAVAAIALTACVQSVDITDCGSVDGTVTSVTVKGCGPGDEYCTFKTGTNAGIDIKFDSKVDTSSAKVKLWAVIAGSPIEFPFTHSDACKEWGLHCPLTKSSHNEFKLQMPVESSYPKIKLSIRVGLEDAAGKLLICQEIPAEIK